MMAASERERLWFIHGNLQQPSVWFRFRDAFQYSNTDGSLMAFDVECENLWKTEANSFWSWASNFCLRVENSAPLLPHWIIGYSQGGRLALHSIVQRPSLWAGAVIVGADTGFPNVEDKHQRLIHDQRWGQRFLTETWENLLTEWDKQSVFGGRPNAAPRDERDFDRKKICRLFDIFSKGRQDDLVPALSKLTVPQILFISGEEDQKYCAIGRKLEDACPTVTHRIIPNAAHRVPWENPELFVKNVQEFLNQVAEERYNKSLEPTACL